MEKEQDKDEEEEGSDRNTFLLHIATKTTKRLWESNLRNKIKNISLCENS